MSRRRVYDNWEKLVEATLKRELFRELAYCSSLSSSSSVGSSFRFDSPLDYVNDLDASSSLSQGAVVGSSSSTVAIKARRFAARLLTVTAIAFAHYIRKKPSPHKQFFYEHSGIDMGNVKIFSLLELQVASDNFSNENILDRAWYNIVYKGRLADGSLVELKRLNYIPSEEKELRIQAEIKIANTIVHPNLRRLLGICATPEERILVYPYFSKGNVASALTLRSEVPESPPPLDWSKRKSIAVGSARGLAYLHDQCDLKIIHLDIKPENIFLDEDFEAVIDDFGWAILFMDHNDTYDITNLWVNGYNAPEYASTHSASERSDVYGYGVTLLELITGKSAPLHNPFASGEYTFLRNVKQLFMEKKLETIVDPNLQGNYIDEEVEQLIKVAILCLQDSPSKRPKMSEVVRMLEGDDLAERWEEWQYEWQNEGMLDGDDQPDTDWIIEQEEFSEPR